MNPGAAHTDDPTRGVDFRPGTGHPGIDEVVGGLRLGDNVVWQTDDIAAFRVVVAHFVKRARVEGRRLVYLRYATHGSLIDDLDGVQVHRLDPDPGFEGFATAVHRIITEEGLGAYYVFDSLTDLLDSWASDLMVMNFFKVTCPYLFELDTIAYFCLLRGQHTFETVAGIRETTQLLLDVHSVGDAVYVHPLKVLGRYSPTMFFPHRIDETTAEPVTSSEETSRLFGRIAQQREPQDRWRVMVERGYAALGGGSIEERDDVRRDLVHRLLGRGGRMIDLALEHLSLQDLLAIADREIGTGYIGGKSVGMLIAGAIAEADPDLAPHLEAHDSSYLGSDLFLTYIIANGWWKNWMAQKDPEGYYEVGAWLSERLRGGQFPPVIRERFLRLLQYFGQSPVIVRSSSLLEDNFGNAFAGKYFSAFCANQGSPEDRLRAFEEAVRSVYASSMSREALRYRENRGLTSSDEQMSVLVQRVSGDHHGDLFFPHAGGVGNSHNQYVFAADIDPAAGALRVVIGLGTRAVDHLSDDYARIIALSHPHRNPVSDEEAGRYSQRKVDVLNLRENALVTVPKAVVEELPIDWKLFLSVDRVHLRRLEDMGRRPKRPTLICDFDGLLHAGFDSYMRALLAKLQAAYDYPVDIEFTVNLTAQGDFRVCLLQCRPLQSVGLGAAVTVPAVDPEKCLVATKGAFMGRNARLDIDFVVLVRPDRYLALGQPQRYAVARDLGTLNTILADRTVMLIGPGRWGTTTTGLGVPVHFSDIDNAKVLVEVTEPSVGFSPELSYGSHFFQELVELDMFFVTVDQRAVDVEFHPGQVTGRENLLPLLHPDSDLADVIHVAAVPGLTLYADVAEQRLVCQSEDV
ncbi:Pyruvate phosphate dikinase, PEP/pyruvate binding domain [Tessaracoccus bendigoensis DSM 12906]|uniref:Pyruvate phosphate dikinase, PEP/pyruvate binding domain n=1 Tax=Tessaracoccus bendigoensis DSM 12906 TaxID=1123357 RepID=A0A1M6EGH9_9ACTN|nr:PEP/pyruvate-binding domain-containing protein [Tessaracoccus bendigoensis]SHI84575.1 Pyruvate phosphate dikinase, PEP/pyruvate binding domain [Tessaracoccus bendigoensis DSM 12906]